MLAVAALIFLVVFLAVPALQRNQRDDARKRDVSNVVQAVVNAAVNTNAMPTPGNAYGNSPSSNLKDYLGGMSMSMNVDYIYVVSTGTTAFAVTNPHGRVAADSTYADSAVPFINKIVVFTKGKCWDGVVGSGKFGHAGIQPGTSSQSAVIIQLENGGDDRFYCQDASY